MIEKIRQIIADITKKDFSDIDIFLITDTELKEKDELSLLFDPVPYKIVGIYISMDTLLQSQE